MESQLPQTLEGESVLAIGVGSGAELGALLRRNPASVAGIDISSSLLEIAQRNYPQVDFYEMDMSNMTFPDGEFNLAYSSLAFDYAKDWDLLLSGVNRVLKPKGALLFSTHHPDYWGKKPATGVTHINERGIELKEHAIGLGAIGLTYYNHPSQESIRDAVEHAGFEIESFFAPQVADIEVSAPEQEAYDKFKLKNAADPMLLIVKAQKSTT